MKVILDCTVVTRCPFCGRANEIAVNEMDYLDWQDGKLAQDAFPYLSASDREMLITGICPDCWDGIFGNENDHFENFIEENDDE